MMHTMQVRVVTRQLMMVSNPEVHKAYYFCPSMLTIGGKDVEAYIKSVIKKDIDKFIEDNPEYKSWVFTIEENIPTHYIW